MYMYIVNLRVPVAGMVEVFNYTNTCSRTPDKAYVKVDSHALLWNI